MARVGPNQDINIFTISTLESLRWIANEASVLANDHNNANSAITENKSVLPLISEGNQRLIQISTLLKKVDGSSIAISGYSTSGNYYLPSSPTPENLALYYESVINTHIDQPERFRGYYDDIMSAVSSWSTRDNGSPITSTDIESQTVLSGLPPSESGGFAKSYITVTQKDGYITIDKTIVPVQIDWFGTSPTNYNSGTYPQLSGAFLNVANEMATQPIPYYSINELVPGVYGDANVVNGFTKSVNMYERASWTGSYQKFAQTSNVLSSESDLDNPILIGSQNLFRIPLLIRNTANIAQSISIYAKITMTPRNPSNRIFQEDHTGFVNKRLWLLGGGGFEIDSSYIVKSSINTSAVNDILTSSFNLDVNGTVLVSARSLGTVQMQIGFVNQLLIGNGSFPGWSTEDLLSDINIQFSADGHFIDQDFAPGLELDMWN